MRHPTIARSAGALAAVVLVAMTAACGGGDDSSSPTSTAATVTTSETTTVPDAGASILVTTTVEAATSTSGPPTTAPADARSLRPYEFEIVTVALNDAARTTTRVDGEVVPGRSLPTTLFLPTTDAPVPLIVFSHGFGASPAKFERLLGAWAAAGYAVAAPAFPLTSDLIDPSERGAGDVVNQPGDVVFVLDQMLSGEYATRFDPDRIAAAGLSLGGLTTYLAAIDESTRDPRFTAAIVMAAVPPGESFSPHAMPTLVMHGELDPVVPVATADAAFAALSPPTYEAVMLGGFHAEPFEDEEENPVFPDRERFHPVVDATTIAFWDTYLLADPSAEGGIAAAGDQPGITTFAARRP